MSKQALALLLCICLIGCSTTTRMTRVEPSSARMAVQVGDEVKAITKDGAVHAFKVSAVTDGHISGNGKSLPLADVQEIEITRFSAAKTAGAVGGGLAAGTIILMVIGMAAFAAAIESKSGDDD